MCSPDHEELAKENGSAEPTRTTPEVLATGESKYSLDSKHSTLDTHCKGLLTTCEMSYIGLAIMGNVSLVFTISFAMTKVWMSNFGLDGRVMGIGTIVGMVAQIVISPIMGRWSDEGKWNFLCFKNTQYWGRRAPMALISVPIALVAVFMLWHLPSGVEAIPWFYTAKAASILSLGCMYNSVSSMAFGEVLPTKSERLTAAQFQSIGVTIAYIVAAGITGVAVSVKPRSPDQAKTFFALAMVNIFLWLFVIPWCVTMRKTVEQKALASNTNLVRDFIDSVRHTPGFFHSSFFNAHFMGGVWVFTGLSPFFLEYVLELDREAVASVTALGFMVLVLGRAVSVPITKMVLADSSAGGCCCCTIHPARLLSVCAAVAGLLWMVLLSASAAMKDNTPLALSLYILNAILGGLIGPVYEMCNRLCLVWVIDWDLVNQGPNERAARRDGFYQSLNLTAINLSFIFLGFAQIILGSVGFVSDKGGSSSDDEEITIQQPESAKQAIMALVAFGTPILWWIGASQLSRYPLRGQKLDDLREKYAMLFDKKKVTVNGDSESMSPTSPVSQPDEGRQGPKDGTQV